MSRGFDRRNRGGSFFSVLPADPDDPKSKCELYAVDPYGGRVILEMTKYEAKQAIAALQWAFEKEKGNND